MKPSIHFALEGQEGGIVVLNTQHTHQHMHAEAVATTIDAEDGAPQANCAGFEELENHNTGNILKHSIKHWTCGQVLHIY
jgi:hypothetical protein